MVFGLQALPVRSEVAAPELMKALPLSLVIWFTASATDEVGTSKIASTLSTSYQVRAMVEQNFRFAAPLADRFYVMEHGRIVETFDAGELASKTELLHEYLGV